MKVINIKLKNIYKNISLNHKIILPKTIPVQELYLNQMKNYP
jgi:hypothetical protein